MNKRYLDNDAFFTELRGLIDGWCDRRCLSSLATLLPAYNSFNGLNDGWGELLRALKALTLSQEEMLPGEPEIVADLRQSAENAMHAR